MRLFGQDNLLLSWAGRNQKFGRSGSPKIAATNWLAKS